MDSTFDSTLLDFCDDDSLISYDEPQIIGKNEEQSKYEFMVLSRDEIVAEMLVDVYDMVNILNVSEPFARVLLNNFQWNKQELIERYYDAADLSTFYKEFNISNPEDLLTSNAINDPSTDCGICYQTFHKTQPFSLQCGHRFCSDCWAEYLKFKILNQGNAEIIECAEHNCRALIDDQSVMELLTDSKDKEIYVTLISNTFVLCNSLLRWCKAPDCEYAVKVTKIESRPVVCKCGWEQCFQCGELWHDPVTCALLKKWMVETMQDIETANWINKNSKGCPSCTVNIEKDGGCNHMTCRSCRHEFCWVCMGPWGTHSCNQYRVTSQNSNVNVLRRLKHYYHRYSNHIKSMQLEGRLNEVAETKMKDLQTASQWTQMEVSFLKRAIDALHRSRQILISTYVFAFYSTPSNQLCIFEDNQRDLEIATEKLSEYLERDNTNDSLSEMKQNVQDLSIYCCRRQNVLLAHVHEGYEKGWWSLDN